MIWFVFSFIFFFGACSFGPGNIQSRHSADLASRKIKRIAVLPPHAETTERKVSALGSPAGEVKVPEKEATETLARLIYMAMAPMPNWQIVAESEVREANPSGAANETARLRRIGEMVYADAVVTGRVLRFRERIGDEWGAKSPASVAFVLELWDVKRGDMVWSARFDETQKPLSENIFAIGDISQRGVRWLTAEQLTYDGVKKAVGQLQQALSRSNS
jgi:TolB-like protein